MELLSIDVDLFYGIPIKCLTYDIIKYSVAQDSEIVLYVPKKYLTKEICFIAVEKNQDLLEDIPKKYHKIIRSALNI
jgi:hypothetical protein